MYIPENSVKIKNRDYDFFNDYYAKTTDEERIKLCVDFINEKLIDKSMCAIVGAGFSRNSNPQFPDWAELLIDAYVEMHPNEGRRKKNECKDDRNRRIVKTIRQIGETVVATEYEKYKGNRESLDVYIENHILPIQKMSQSSNVHETFLQLNWCDIVTTNWDNLLEKADVNKRYNVVCSAKELKYSNKDRIVKIHGSIRVDPENFKYEYDGCFDHLYLITEKDFENYPINHEGFSNFMKVKILENSFCLFGFSGNDWNFRYWVKELKRMMTKGGQSSSLNPIFLFDVSNQPYNLAQKQFFRNNYIIPLKLDDIFILLEGVETPESPQKVAEKFQYVFSWFLQRKKENDVLEFGQKRSADNKTLQKLAFEEQSSNLNDLMQAYIKLPKFDIRNLDYTRFVAQKIQVLGNNYNSWSELEYLFVYTWCQNNFWSLTQLFPNNKVELIINNFIDKQYYKTNAYVFSELVFKYYGDCGKTEELKKIELLLAAKNEDLVLSQKGKYYFKTHEFEKLKELLGRWTPEKKEIINPLYVLCKISLRLVIEKIYDNENECNIESLFEIALKNCKQENQLLVFTLLYYKYWKVGKNFNQDSRLTELTNGLVRLNPVYPKRYLDLLTNENKRENFKNNAQKRYQTTFSLAKDNYNEIKHTCFLNFFDYLNLPMEGIVLRNEYVKLISKVDDCNLIDLYSHAFYYFGQSADEDCIQTFIPLFLRRFSENTKKFLFEKYLDLFECKVLNNENPKTICFLLNEFAKHMDDCYSKRFYDLFYELFSCERNNSLKRLAEHGRVWGIYTPLIDYLNQISDEAQFNYMFQWIVTQCVSKTEENYEIFSYKNYYHALLCNKKLDSSLRRAVLEKKFISKIENQFEDHYFLALDAYDFINKNLKRKCKDFLKQNISLEINPYFLKTCYSKEAKERIVDIIENKDFKRMNSADWPISGYIQCMREIKKLNVADLKKMCQAMDRLAKMYSGDMFVFDYYRNWIKPYYETIKEIFESGNDGEKNAVKDSIGIFKPIYEEKSKDVLDFSWLSASNGEKFRDSFQDLFSYSRTMNKEKECVSCVGLALSKILLDDGDVDVSKYEAVLQIFINHCKNKFWFELMKTDSAIKTSVVYIMKKFEKGVPLCYDDIFIKKKMVELAEMAEKMGIIDNVVTFWKNSIRK